MPPGDLVLIRSFCWAAGVVAAAQVAAMAFVIAGRGGVPASLGMRVWLALLGWLVLAVFSALLFSWPAAIAYVVATTRGASTVGVLLRTSPCALASLAGLAGTVWAWASCLRG